MIGLLTTIQLACSNLAGSQPCDWFAHSHTASLQQGKRYKDQWWCSSALLSNKMRYCFESLPTWHVGLKLPPCKRWGLYDQFDIFLLKIPLPISFQNCPHCTHTTTHLITTLLATSITSLSPQSRDKLINAAIFFLHLND